MLEVILGGSAGDAGAQDGAALPAAVAAARARRAAGLWKQGKNFVFSAKVKVNLREHECADFLRGRPGRMEHANLASLCHADNPQQAHFLEACFFSHCSSYLGSGVKHCICRDSAA